VGAGVPHVWLELPHPSCRTSLAGSHAVTRPTTALWPYIHVQTMIATIQSRSVFRNFTTLEHLGN